MTSIPSQTLDPRRAQRPGQWFLLVFLALSAIAIGGVLALVAYLGVHFLMRHQVAGDSPEKHGISKLPSSRLGGMLVVGFVLLSTLWYHLIGDFPLLRDGQGIATIVAMGFFALGLLEDITGLLPPLRRLVIMALMAVALLWLDSTLPMRTTSIGVLDALLSIEPLAYLFSLLGILFLVNASNAADGANGLLSGTAIVAFWLLAQITGLVILIPLMSGLMVFFLINVSTGNLFLGDSGAYLVGVVLAIALIYAANLQAVSPWLLMSLVFYPTADFLVSLVRRLCWGEAVMAADNFHFHNMLHAELDRGGWSPLWANSLTGLGVLLVWTVPTLVFFLLGLPDAAWGGIYVLYWLVFLGLWMLFFQRQKEIATPSPSLSSGQDSQ